MAVRTITFSASLSGVTPSSAQKAGIAGEHNATNVVINLSAELIAALGAAGTVYRFEYVDGDTGFDTTENYTLAAGSASVNVDLPNGWTSAGGQAILRLVIAHLDADNNEDLTLYSLPCRLVFDSRDKGGIAAPDTVTKGLSGLIADTNAVKDAAGAAEALRVTAESNRAAAENGRVTSESGRAAAEQGRATSESFRASAENTRRTNETNRANAESSRATVESGRAATEANRVSAESSRVTAENNRITAESNRASTETSRSNAESSRATAEQRRVDAEGDASKGRVKAENGRVTAENSRVTAEQNRVSAEQSRVTAESARQAEVIAARSSTLKGAAYGSLGARLDGIDTDNAGRLVASYTHTANAEIAVTAVDISTDTFTKPSHGLTNGNMISPFMNLGAIASNPLAVFPTGLTNKRYYVINATTDTFQVSLTAGGAAVDITAAGDITQWHFEKFSGSNGLTINFTNLPTKKTYRVVLKLRKEGDGSFYVLPSQWALTSNWYTPTGSVSYPTLGFLSAWYGNIWSVYDVLLSSNLVPSILCRAAAIHATSTATVTNTVSQFSFVRSAASTSDMTAINVQFNNNIANGSTVEVYN